MLTLNEITICKEGKRIDYDYSYTENIEKYFIEKNPFYIKYEKEIRSVPKSINIIPFLANILPIAWFAGFSVHVNEVDEDFYNSQILIKKQFSKRYPSKLLKGDLIPNNIIKNRVKGDNSAMLFSGGVDAFATYIRNIDKIPDLITIHGADIEIVDKEQWNSLKGFIVNQPLLSSNIKHFVECNLRDFYSYNVDLLLPDLGWWGKVQHGLALVGSLAPLSIVSNYNKIFIASSYTDHININWGSIPEIDEKISWAGLQVIHDGYDMKRQDKVDLISEFSVNSILQLRVCYSDLRKDANCSNCEKCFRTILGIILAGKNPNDFGFKVTKEFYPAIFNRLNNTTLSKGAKYFWWELMEKAKTTNNYFILEDKNFELSYIKRIKEGEIDELFTSNISKASKTNIDKYKFIIRNRFPFFYKIYQNLKY